MGARLLCQWQRQQVLRKTARPNCPFLPWSAGVSGVSLLLSLRACVAWPAPRHSSIQEEPFLGPAVEQMHVSHSHLAMPAGTRGDFHYWRQIAGGALGLSQRAACRSASEMRCGRRPVRDKSADALAGHVNTGRENERKLTSRETKKKKKQNAVRHRDPRMPPHFPALVRPPLLPEAGAP